MSALIRKSATPGSCSLSGFRKTVERASVVAFFVLSHAGAGQTVFLDNFDDGNDTSTPAGWIHYAPLNKPPFNSEATWTFPYDDGGKAYRMFGGAPQDASGGPVRVGSFRGTPSYSDFFIGVDLMHWDDKLINNVGFMIARASLSRSQRASGYLAGYISDAEGFADNPGQAAFMLVGFQSDINISTPDRYTGGMAFLSRLNPLRKYRMVFSGAGVNLKAALCDRTDLLEPVVGIAALNSMNTNGISGIGALNLDDDKPTDFTFDNYLATTNPATPVGFPGTPQVVDLRPRRRHSSILFRNPTQSPSRCALLTPIKSPRTQSNCSSIELTYPRNCFLPICPQPRSRNPISAFAMPAL